MNLLQYINFAQPPLRSPDGVIHIVQVELRRCNLRPGSFISRKGEMCHILSVGEMEAAVSGKLGYDFLKHKSVPVCDLGENDFICMGFRSTPSFFKLNIVDKTRFGKTSKDIRDLL